MRRLAALAVMVAGPALAEPPATVRLPDAPRTASEFRLKALPSAANPLFHIDDPRSPLRSGYGGSMVDLFPVAGGNFHFSAGPRLFGRAGRPRSVDPENLRLLPSARGPRLARRFSPAMLVGYGHTVDQGLALGFDVGMVVGRVMQMPDRLGRLNRQRLDSVVGRSRQGHSNELARVTALYRF